MNDVNKGKSNGIPILFGAILGGLAGTAWGFLAWPGYWWLGIVLAVPAGAMGGFMSEKLIEAGCLAATACIGFLLLWAFVLPFSEPVAMFVRPFGFLLGGLAFGKVGGAIARRDF